MGDSPRNERGGKTVEEKRDDVEMGVLKAKDVATGEGSAEVGPSGSSDSCGEADCRICLLSDSVQNMVTPCACEGTLAFCHYDCLEQWVKESRSLNCEICNAPYVQPYKSRLSSAIPKTDANPSQRTNEAAAEVTAVDLSTVQWHYDQGGAAQAKKLWCRMILLTALTITLLYIILFVSNGRSNFSNWTVMILRVLSFVLPFYLLGRALIALRRYRQEREQEYN